MTFNEILAQVSWNVWGNTTISANSAGILTNRIIPDAHRQIQRDYNYWFMQTWAEITTQLGLNDIYLQAYALPDGFKELISVQWQRTNSDGDDLGKTEPLLAMPPGYAQRYFWPSDNLKSVEYPTHYEIVNNMIVFYPDINAVRTAIMVYFQILDCPTGDNDDELLIHGDQAVISKSTALLYKSLHDVANFQTWIALYDDEIAILRGLDFSKRFSSFKEIIPDAYGLVE